MQTPSTPQALEEGSELNVDWDKLRSVVQQAGQVVPTVVQDADTGEVLILAYVNAQALEETRRRQIAVFWSTSRNELWIKGATSGDTLRIHEIRVNCEQNSLLYLVHKTGPGSCHTKEPDGTPRSGCYYRRLQADGRLEHAGTVVF
jgi:phosphoribosyl-AMP cyclohydrolase